MIFFNDEGTENGGFTFTGSKGAERPGTRVDAHVVRPVQPGPDPRAQLRRGSARAGTGISVLDRASIDILDMVNERDSIQKALAGDTAALRAAMTRWAGPRNGEPLAAQRMFVGSDPAKSALMALSDPQGKVRLRLAVDSLGAARIEFLDAAGNVTRSLP